MTGCPSRGGPAPGVVHEVALTATVAVSFQRFPCPSDGILAGLPRSWGALPMAVDEAGNLFVPVPDGEALWIGLIRPRGAEAQPLSVVALLAPGGPTDAVTGRPAGKGRSGRLDVPPARDVPGVARPDGGWWALTRTASAPGAPACSALEFSAGDRLMVTRLVDPAAFTDRTGAAVPPLDPAARYGGRRLP